MADTQICDVKAIHNPRMSNGNKPSKIVVFYKVLFSVN